MKARLVLFVALASLVPTSVAVASSGSAGGDMRPATRILNQKSVDEVPTTVAAPSVQLVAELEAVLAETNAQRVANGLAPFTLEARLTQAAQGHSEDQAAMRLLTHTGSDGSTPGDRITRSGYVWRTWAENAAAGYRDGTAVVIAWMNSAGHRANLMNPQLTEIGLGLAYTADGYPYWTQAFAAPR